MKLIQLTCRSCNAPLEIDIDNLHAYCPYCNQKLLFDLDQMERVLAEKEQTKRSQEKTKRAEEATRRTQIKYEYEDKKDRREKTANRNMLIGFVLFSVLFCIFSFGYLSYSIKSTEQEHLDNNEVKVSVSAKDLKEETVENAKEILQNCGFQNVSTTNKGDLVFGVFSKEGEIDSISINGNKKFSSGDWFPADAVVVITYHGFSKD